MAVLGRRDRAGGVRLARGAAGRGRADRLRARRDAVVAAAAQRGLPVLPVVHRHAGRGRRRARATARRRRREGTAAYTQFLTALVGRYGPSGSLWAEQPALPRMPIRDWQIWNEPNLTRYWSDAAVRARPT